MAIQVNDYSFVSQAMRFIADKSAWRYALAFFIAFGPLVALPLFDWRRSLRFLADQQHLLFIATATALLAYVGGSDTERFLYWSMPVVYVLVGRAIQNRRPALGAGLALTLVVAQCISQRLLWTTPDFSGDFAHRLPLLTPPSGEVPYRDLLAVAAPQIAAWSLVEYMLLGALTLIWLAVRERRSAR